jgi:PAS domain S-box-containing protein
VATDWPRQDVQRRRRLEPRPESARSARQAVLEALAEAGRDDLADAAGLLVSELVTNAIVHARTAIDLDVVAGPAGLRVAVRDRNPHLPALRHYGRAATTGRGLELVELMSDRHGTQLDGHDGKTVWFELGSHVGSDAPNAEEVPAPDDVADLTVRLCGLPMTLALAWQQHADALLRELTLARWDPDGPPGGVPPADDVAAADAFATVNAALEALGPVRDLPAYVDVPVPMSRDTAAHFRELDALLDHAIVVAERGLTLAPPTQPEIRLLRRWICAQAVQQAQGAAPEPWPGLPSELPAADLTAVEWDTSVVRTATEAVIAADDRNRILAASPAAFDLLGWDDDPVGRRIVAVIPERFREAHIAAFTLHLLTGETRILDREVAVPALRRDGTEVAVRLLVQRDSAAEGHTVFVATLRTP